MKLTSKQKKALEEVKVLLESQPLTSSYARVRGNSYTIWVNDFLTITIGRTGQASATLTVPAE